MRKGPFKTGLKTRKPILPAFCRLAGPGFCGTCRARSPKPLQLGVLLGWKPPSSAGRATQMDHGSSIRQVSG